MTGMGAYGCSIYGCFLLLFLELLLKLERIRKPRTPQGQWSEQALSVLTSHPLPPLHRDKRLMAVCSGGFVIVATVNLAVFIYLVVAVVIKVHVHVHVCR